jgi:hypothetical protein
LLLLIGFVVLGTTQATVIPQENRQTEFAHAQQVQGQLTSLRSAAVTVAESRDRQRSVRVDLGTRYPNRPPPFINPPPASGHLRSLPAEPLRLTGFEGSGETGDWWDGSPRTLPTRAVVYESDYNRYQSAPSIVFEHGGLYREFTDTRLFQERPGLVHGRTIRLLTATGDLGEVGVGTADVSLSSATTRTRTVVVGDDGTRPTVEVPTTLPEEEWRDLFEPQLVANGGHVERVDYRDRPSSAYNLLTVELQRGVKYRLQLSRVHLGDTGPDPTPAYVTVTDGPDGSPPGSTVNWTVEVRDRRNGPLSGETVELRVNEGRGSLASTTVTTDGDGKAIVRYDSDGSDSDVEVEATFRSFGGGSIPAKERAIMTTTMDATAGGAEFDIRFKDPRNHNPSSAITCPTGRVCEIQANQLLRMTPPPALVDFGGGGPPGVDGAPPSGVGVGTAPPATFSMGDPKSTVAGAGTGRPTLVAKAKLTPRMGGVPVTVSSNRTTVLSPQETTVDTKQNGVAVFRFAAMGNGGFVRLTASTPDGSRASEVIYVDDRSVRPVPLLKSVEIEDETMGDYSNPNSIPDYKITYKITPKIIDIHGQFNTRLNVTVKPYCGGIRCDYERGRPPEKEWTVETDDLTDSVAVNYHADIDGGGGDYRWTADENIPTDGPTYFKRGGSRVTPRPTDCQPLSRERNYYVKIIVKVITNGYGVEYDYYDCADGFDP